MKYFEILYENCIGKKYVGLSYGKNLEEVKERFLKCGNSCRFIDIKETTCECCKRNKIQHFTQYNFSVS